MYVACLVRCMAHSECSTNARHSYDDKFNLQGTYSYEVAAGPIANPGQGFAMNSSKALKKEELQLYIFFLSFL